MRLRKYSLTHHLWSLVTIYCVCCAVYRAAEEGQPRKTVVVVGGEGSVRSSVLVPLVFAVPRGSADCRGGRRAVRCVVSERHRLHRATLCVCLALENVLTEET